MRIGSNNDDVRKNETKSNIACAHPSESKRKRKKKIENTKKQVVMGSE
jgi:hypothetical protein